MEEREPFFDFMPTSRAFLERAREHLKRFDQEEDVSSFFYAALELRFGIEARVSEYLESALGQLGRRMEDVPDYVASRLLARLREVSPKAEGRVRVRLIRQVPARSSEFHFTPVTRELAMVHGRLGGLLHYKFFVSNENWFLRESLAGRGRSLVDFRLLLAEAEEGLAKATAGTLLCPPYFTALVKEVLKEPPEGQP